MAIYKTILNKNPPNKNSSITDLSIEFPKFNLSIVSVNPVFDHVKRVFLLLIHQELLLLQFSFVFQMLYSFCFYFFVLFLQNCWVALDLFSYFWTSVMSENRFLICPCFVAISISFTFLRRRYICRPLVSRCISLPPSSFNLYINSFYVRSWTMHLQSIIHLSCFPVYSDYAY